VQCQLSITAGQSLLYLPFSAALFLHSQQVFIAVSVGHNYFVCIGSLESELDLVCYGFFYAMRQESRYSLVKTLSTQWYFYYICTLLMLYVQQRNGVLMVVQTRALTVCVIWTTFPGPLSKMLRLMIWTVEAAGNEWTWS
jgi:hypothetical protein